MNGRSYIRVSLILVFVELIIGYAPIGDHFNVYLLSGNDTNHMEVVNSITSFNWDSSELGDFLTITAGNNSQSKKELFMDQGYTYEDSISIFIYAKMNSDHLWTKNDTYRGLEITGLDFSSCMSEHTIQGKFGNLEYLNSENCTVGNDGSFGFKYIFPTALLANLGRVYGWVVYFKFTDGLTTSFITSNDISSSQFSSSPVSSSQLTSSQITSTEITSSKITSSDITSSKLTSYGLTSSPITSSISPVSSNAITTRSFTSSQLTSDSKAQETSQDMSNPQITSSSPDITSYHASSAEITSSTELSSNAEVTSGLIKFATSNYIGLNSITTSNREQTEEESEASVLSVHFSKSFIVIVVLLYYMN